jgi:uncharacterized RDD family membrane protein YckC
VSPYAGLATRTLAFALDAAIINAVAWFVALVVAVGLSVIEIPDEVVTALAAVGALIGCGWAFAYFVFFWSTSGQTPGNRVFGIRVTTADGGVVGGRRAALRVPALVLSAIPLCAGFLMILVDDRRRALHDRLVKTVVVYAVADAEPADQTSRRLRTANARTMSPTPCMSPQMPANTSSV